MASHRPQCLPPVHRRGDAQGHATAALLGGLPGDLVQALPAPFTVPAIQLDHAAFHSHGYQRRRTQLRQLLGDKIQLVRLGQALVDGHPHRRLVVRQKLQQIYRNATAFDPADLAPPAPARSVHGADFIPRPQPQHLQRVLCLLGGQRRHAVHRRFDVKAVHVNRRPAASSPPWRTIRPVWERPPPQSGPPPGRAVRRPAALRRCRSR